MFVELDESVTHRLHLPVAVQFGQISVPVCEVGRDCASPKAAGKSNYGNSREAVSVGPGIHQGILNVFIHVCICSHAE